MIYEVKIHAGNKVVITQMMHHRFMKNGLNNLDTTDVKLIFDGEVLIPFLEIGMTVAIFHSNDFVNINENGKFN